MTAYIDTGLSLILIFFIFSVIAYIIQELVAINLEYRGKFLYNALAHVLEGRLLEGRKAIVKILRNENDGKAKTEDETPDVKKSIVTSLTQELYNHPQIRSLQQNAKRLPSYVPAANFALALLDTVATNATNKEGDLLARVREGLKAFTDADGNIGTVLKNLVDTSVNLADLQAKLEAWYTEYMDRVTGWYKSHTLLTLRLIALGVVLFFNVNVLSLAKEIFTNARLRENLVVLADRVVDHPEANPAARSFAPEADRITNNFLPRIDSAKTDSARRALQKEKADSLDAAAARYTAAQRTATDTLAAQLFDTGLPIGWRKSVVDTLGGLGFWDVVWMLLGWLIAAGCVSMGAPFWFDLLVKVVNIRRAGIKPTAGDSKRQ